ncbi:MAG: aminopeptidase P family protein [Rhizobiaceae bacterium]|nr:aminopeptidase P family protein [Rhizobiaceae bacterium]
MFQQFATLSRPETAKPRVEALRQLFDKLEIDAVLVPKSDEYLGEYIPPYAERLAWLTSFTGSAGSALILKDKAVIFTDGRYTSQVAKQSDADVFDFEDLVSNPPSKWIKENAPKGLRLGIDPWLLPSASVEKLEEALKTIGGKLIIFSDNPVDAVWEDQPNTPLEPVSIQPDIYSGKLAKVKISELQAGLKDDKDDATVIADPTAIAWLFNIRGNDVMHTPVALSRAIILADGTPQLFMDKRKLDMEVEAYLNQLADLNPPSEFESALKELGEQTKTVSIDSNTASHAISMILKESGANLIDRTDPVLLPRAIKNAAEIDGSILAHKIDGAAMVSFICWLKSQAPETLDEIAVAKKLEATRAEYGAKHQNPLKDISFDTISGSGPHAAIIHYRVDEDSNRKLQSGEMILVDSGGQFECGTTDITRTISLGDVPEEQKKYFTLVLKGMIDISLLRFPKGTRGVDIDAFARAALWKHGVDYAHGTGHGVGSYLAVHEGPQNISKRSMVEYQPGMIVSNEPGYYRDGGFGIRIENLVYIHEPRDIELGETAMMGFETLTLCPIDQDLILPELMTDEQINWLNTYHATVREVLTPYIDDEAAVSWLNAQTEPIRAS